MNEISERFKKDFPILSGRDSLMDMVIDQINEDLEIGLYDGKNYDDYFRVGRMIEDDLRETFGGRPQEQMKKPKIETVSDIIADMRADRGQSDEY